MWSGGWSEWLKILRDTGGSTDNQFLRHQPLCHLRETLGVPFFSLADSSLSFKTRVWFANLVMSDLIMFSHHALLWKPNGYSFYLPCKNETTVTYYQILTHQLYSTKIEDRYSIQSQFLLLSALHFLHKVLAFSYIKWILTSSVETFSR